MSVRINDFNSSAHFIGFQHQLAQGIWSLPNISIPGHHTGFFNNESPFTTGETGQIT